MTVLTYFTYSSLCAFAINNDEADTLSSVPPFSKILDPPLKGTVLLHNLLSFPFKKRLVL